MFLTLYVDQEESCLYTARVMAGTVEVADFQASSVADAIRAVAEAEFGATAFHVWCGGIGIGTTPTHTMLQDAEALASRLMALHGELHHDK